VGPNTSGPSVPPTAPPCGSSSPPSDYQIKLYEIYRARVVAEDNLVNYRLTWIVLLQAPLFAVAIAIIVRPELVGYLKKYQYIQSGVLFALFLFSIAFLFFGAWAVIAAFGEIKYLRGRYLHAVGTEHPSLPSITGQEIRHFAGSVLPYMIILGLFGGWCVILALGVFYIVGG
jgi:hypothetical protein